MALGAGPAADARVGVDILAATAEPRAALKQLRKEIKQVENELQELVRAGDNIEQKTAQLRKLEQQQKQLGDIDKRNREIEARTRRALTVAKVANSVLSANAIVNIAKNGVDAQSLFSLTSLAMTNQRSMLKAFGRGGARAAAGFAPWMPIIGAVISSATDAWDEFTKRQEGFKSVSMDFRQGKVTKAEEEYARHVLENTWDDPLEAQKRVRNVGESIAKLDAQKTRDVIKKLNAEEIKAPVSMGPFFASVPKLNTPKINANELLRAIALEELVQTTAEGKQLSQQQYADAVTKVIADIAKRDNLPKEFLEKLSKSMMESMDAHGELSHKEKFKDELKKAEEMERHRKRFIPARLEY